MLRTIKVLTGGAFWFLSVIKGTISAVLLLAFYFVIASLLGGISFAVGNFAALWYWMTPLVIGFGIQIGLFFYIKDEMHKKAGMQAAASTGVSSASMVACCAHHIADIAPFLGISALGLFLTKYQTTFLTASIFSNLLGIAYMLSIANTKIPKFTMKMLFYSLLLISIVAVLVSYLSISKPETEDKSQKFQTLISSENNVEFSITPLAISEFEIYIITHSVELDFELTEISVLYDDLGNIYKPLNWDGSPPGGHHRNGILKFQEVDNKANSIKLIINDGTGREFIWRIE